MNFFKNKKEKNPSIIIEEILSEPDDPVEILKMICEWIRPSSLNDSKFICQRVSRLESLLNENPQTNEKLGEILRNWLEKANYFLAFAVLGLFSRQGFLRELVNRVYEHINPAPLNKQSLSDALSIIFSKEKNPKWVNEIPEETWLRLFKILWNQKPGEGFKLLAKTINELLYALEMLGIWVAAEELEKDLVRIEPAIVQRDSAFVALQREISMYCRNYENWISGEIKELEDDSHIRVLLEQCVLSVKNFRKKSVTKGTSIGLSYLLERLDQTLERIKRILDLLNPNTPDTAKAASIKFFRELVNASRQRYSIKSLVSQNVNLLSRSITENTSDHGEHYITKTRKDYFKMFLSGAGGGVFIAVMAMIKIKITQIGFSPFPETVLVCLNYGIGFMIIHMMHFTVATKQPAMTASRFAQVLQQGEHGGANPKTLANLLIQVSRSQFIAIIGNVSIAILLAFSFGYFFLNIFETSIISAKKSGYLLNELRPIASFAVFHAAIAGVWLFVSGLVAGFFDNRAAYLGLGQRLKYHPVLTIFLPIKAREKFGNYMQENYGALAGNFIFGVLLGVTSYIGYLLNFPLGIRHVAFSSANFGYALSVSIPGLTEIGLYLFFIFLISAMNLWVSFSLALYVALRARNLKVTSFSKIMKALSGEIRKKPLSLFFPPGNSKTEKNKT
jgi:site-specific recombinase